MTSPVLEARLRPPLCHGGFTLLELMLSLAMLGLLLSLATPSWSHWIQRQKLEMASRELQSVLAQWRRMSLDTQQPVRLSLYPAPSPDGTPPHQCVLIHTGSPTDCRCSPEVQDLPATSCRSPAQRLQDWVVRHADGLTLAGNVGSLRMDPRLGTVTPTGTLSLKGTGDLEVKHIVNVLGRVRVCSDARIGGWPAC